MKEERKDLGRTVEEKRGYGGGGGKKWETLCVCVWKKESVIFLEGSQP
jgi:hypothetical protein